MATDLVMKVKADVKDASKALKDLGYNVEQVEAKTKKAKEQQDLWHKAMEKGSKDNIKHLVDMGAKIVSFTALTAAAYKGIKSCVDEALKQNEEAKKKIEQIQTVWNEIKADLGQKLLDTVTPALDNLYEKLKEIRDWADENTRRRGIATALHSGMSGQEIYAVFGKEAIENFQEEIYGNRAYNADEQQAFSEAYILARMASNEKFANAMTALVENKANGGTGGAASVTAYYDKWAGYGDHMAKRDAAEIARRSSDTGINDPIGDARRKWAFYSGNYSVEEGAYLDKTGTYYWDTEVGAWKSLAVKKASIEEEARQKEKEAETAHLEEMRKLRESYYSDLRSLGMQSISALTGAYTQSLDNQMRAVEQSSLAEEEKNRKMNELAEKQFDAERLNSAASVAMSTAESIMNIWSEYGSSPAYAAVLTGLVGATSAVQLSTIASQQYTPFAQGGIVSGPTRAIIGEGSEKEAIMPLSKLREFVQPQEGGTISITVNVSSDGRGKEEIADAVFYAIERAQRTGALPRWRYAS